jgi:hypothetical protein
LCNGKDGITELWAFLKNTLYDMIDRCVPTPERGNEGCIYFYIPAVGKQSESAAGPSKTTPYITVLDYVERSLARGTSNESGW